MTQKEALNTLMKMRAWRAWGKEQKEEERPEMPEQKDVDEAFDVCIKLLQQSTLPSNLDEAAEEYALDVKAKPYGNLVKDAFKAGAKWMAGQGVIVNGVISRDDLIYDLYTPELDDVLDASWEDKNVIVQIRK